MKKGISSQIFVYIFAAIVMALILYFGFTQIAGLKDLSDKSTYIVFKNDFTEAVNDIYYKNKGSVMVFSLTSRNKPLILPNGIDNVCFEGDKVQLTSADYNNFRVDYLSGSGCINIVNDLFSFRLENMGDTVSVI